MSTNYMPEGYHSITPYLSIARAKDAIDFYKRAFNAEEMFRLATPDGDIMHAEIKIGDSHIMLAESCQDTEFKDPGQLGGTSIGIHLYVANVDQLFSQALEAGAKMIKPVEDQFYGDRNGTLEDPFGHYWFLSTHIETLTPEEIAQRAAELFSAS